MNSLTVLFLITLGLMVSARLWLARRQLHHVLAHRGRVPKPFERKITLAVHKKAADYTVAKVRLGLIEIAVGAVLLILWTLGGGLDTLDRLWRHTDWDSIVVGVLFITSFVLIAGLLELPASVYRTFAIEQRFGFNRTTLGLFVTDLIKNTVLLIVIGVPLAFAALWLMQVAGPTWWLYVWLLWIGFSLLLTWAYPALIAPLFNTFTPLENESTKQRIQALLQRTGFASRGIFVMDGSRRSTHGNAYFTGFGRNKRIVFFDNLLQSLDDEEIEAVLAHELGHFKCHHVVKRLSLSFALSLCGLGILGWLAEQPWFYTGLGASEPSDYMALTLFIMVSPVFAFFFQPVLAWGSRRHEYEADAFAAKHANAKELIDALIKLYEENANTLTSDPLHSAFYDSHPPAASRIANLQAAG